jgi:hypothetical protein
MIVSVGESNRPPTLAVNVNMDEILMEVMGILQLTKDEMRNVTRLVNDKLDANLESVSLM